MAYFQSLSWHKHVPQTNRRGHKESGPNGTPEIPHFLLLTAFSPLLHHLLTYPHYHLLTYPFLQNKLYFLSNTLLIYFWHFIKDILFSDKSPYKHQIININAMNSYNHSPT